VVWQGLQKGRLRLLDARSLEADLRGGEDARRASAQRDEKEGAGGGVEGGGTLCLLPAQTPRPGGRPYSSKDTPYEKGLQLAWKLKGC